VSLGGLRLLQARGKKIRTAFPARAAAVAWRDDSRSAVRKGAMQAPPAATLAEAAEAWLEGARSGLICAKLLDTLSSDKAL